MFAFYESLLVVKKRAENGTRTRDPNLGKVVLYQLSYFRIFFPLSRSISLDCGCKGNAFFGTDKLFCYFFSKKGVNPSYFDNLRSQIGVKSPVFHRISASRWRGA